MRPVRYSADAPGPKGRGGKVEVPRGLGDGIRRFVRREVVLSMAP